MKKEDEELGFLSVPVVSVVSLLLELVIRSLINAVANPFVPSSSSLESGSELPLYLAWLMLSWSIDTAVAVSFTVAMEGASNWAAFSFFGPLAAAAGAGAAVSTAATAAPAC